MYSKMCKIGNLMSSTRFTGCSSVWLERLVWDQEVVGSSPVTPILYLPVNKALTENHLHITAQHFSGCTSYAT